MDIMLEMRCPLCGHAVAEEPVSRKESRNLPARRFTVITCWEPEGCHIRIEVEETEVG